MRLLIVTNLYAPDRAPRAFRWSAVAEHWAAQGHEIHVVAAWKAGDREDEVLNGVHVHRVGSKIGQRLRALLRRRPHAGVSGGGALARTSPGVGWLGRGARIAYDLTWRRLFWPDYSCLWFFSARKKAEKLLGQGQWDGLISVSHPFTGHMVGLALKRSHPALRWLADIGDPFSFFTEIPMNNVALYTGLNRRAERAVLKRADVVSVTVDACKDAYRQFFSDILCDIRVIPPVLSLPDQIQPSQPLFGAGRHLVYVGTLYRAIRNPAPLILLMRGLVERGQDVHAHFFGDVNDCAEEMDAAAKLLPGRLHLHGSVSRDQVAQAISQAAAVINIGNTTTHQLPSKLIEYAALGKPVLNVVVVDGDTSVDFLSRYKAALNVTSDVVTTRQCLDAVEAFLRQSVGPTTEEIKEFVAPYLLDHVAQDYMQCFV